MVTCHDHVKQIRSRCLPRIQLEMVSFPRSRISLAIAFKKLFSFFQVKTLSDEMPGNTYIFSKNTVNFAFFNSKLFLNGSPPKSKVPITTMLSFKTWTLLKQGILYKGSLDSIYTLPQRKCRFLEVAFLLGKDIHQWICRHVSFTWCS